MIDKEYVYKNVLPLIKEQGRMIDYYLVKSLFENVDDSLIEELLKYQNKDSGFGHGLEPDSLCESSSIVSTEKAIEALYQVRDAKKKEPIIKDIVSYLEQSYDPEKDGFKLITKDVNTAPRAVWWNYEDYDKNFPYGNPDGFVIGFLFKNRRYLKDLNINRQINNMVSFIRGNQFSEASMHILFNVLKFNKYVDNDIKNLIHDKIHFLVDKLVEEDSEKWSDYSLEPYKIYVIDPHFASGHNKLLEKNLNNILKEVKNLSVMPKWRWYQYDDVFEDKVKYMWMGHLYFEYIKALRLHRFI